MSKWVREDSLPSREIQPAISRGRAIAAVAAGISTVLVIAYVIVPLSGMMLEAVNSTLHPDAGSAWGYNTGELGTYARWSFYGLWLAAAIVVAALVLDPGFGGRTETVVVLLLFLLAMAVSGVNYVFHDHLMLRSGQAALDIVLAVLGLSLVLALWRWRPSRDLLASLRFVALFLVMTFGFLTPMMFFVLFTLDRVGVELDVQKGWVEAISAIVSLIGAIVAGTTADRRGTGK